MNEILEQYGDILMAVIATVAIIAIIIYACSSSGILSDFVSVALEASC